jgi:hypothetical protein
MPATNFRAPSLFNSIAFIMRALSAGIEGICRASAKKAANPNERQPTNAPAST